MLPAATLNGAEGDVVAPSGNPESAMVTGLANPFWPTTETVNFELELPASAAIAAGDSIILKSLGGGGGDAGDATHPTRLPSHRKIQAPPKPLHSVMDGRRINQSQMCNLTSRALTPQP